MDRVRKRLHGCPCDIRAAYFIEHFRVHGYASDGFKIAAMMNLKQGFYNVLEGYADREEAGRHEDLWHPLGYTSTQNIPLDG